jgi:RNA polymerase sigma factor (sigma-70 family)
LEALPEELQDPSFDTMNAALFQRLADCPDQARSIKGEILTNNKGLVYAIASTWFQWRYHHLPHPEDARFQDLVSAGNVGLLESIDRFQSERGNKFSTYAVWHINNQVRQESGATDSVVLKGNVKTELYTLRRLRSKLAKELGLRHIPDELVVKAYIAFTLTTGKEPVGKTLESVQFSEGLAHWPLPARQIRLSLRLQQLLACYRQSHSTKSLHAPVGSSGDDSAELGNLVGDERADAPDDIVARDECQAIENEALREALFSLRTPRERDILLLRKGLLGIGMTLNEIAALYRVTRERIRQIEDGAMRSLKTRMESPESRSAHLPPLRPVEKEAVWNMIQQEGWAALTPDERKLMLLSYGLDYPLEIITRIGDPALIHRDAFTADYLVMVQAACLYKLARHQVQARLESSRIKDKRAAVSRFQELIRDMEPYLTQPSDGEAAPPITIREAFLQLKKEGYSGQFFKKYRDTSTPSSSKRPSRSDVPDPRQAVSGGSAGWSETDLSFITVIEPVDAETDAGKQDGPHRGRKKSGRSEGLASIRSAFIKRPSARRAAAHQSVQSMDESTLRFLPECPEALITALKALPKEERLVVGMMMKLYESSPPTLDAVVDRLGMSRATLFRLRNKAMITLGKAGDFFGEGSSLKLHSRQNDVAKAKASVDPAQWAGIKTGLEQQAPTMDAVQLRVLQYRLGLHPESAVPMSLEEVAGKLGYGNIESVRQIQKKALAHIAETDNTLASQLQPLLFRLKKAQPGTAMDSSGTSFDTLA